MATYTVTWPEMAVRVNGRDRVLSRGDTVPAGVPAGTIQALASAGAVVLQSETAEATDTVVEALPAKSAPKGEWVAYALGQGMSEEDANKAKKTELVEQFTQPAEAEPPQTENPGGDKPGDGGGGPAGDGSQHDESGDDADASSSDQE